MYITVGKHQPDTGLRKKALTKRGAYSPDMSLKRSVHEAATRHVGLIRLTQG